MTMSYKHTQLTQELQYRKVSTNSHDSHLCLNDKGNNLIYFHNNDNAIINFFLYAACNSF